MPYPDLVDRDLYPAQEFPAGQWDYMRYYEESFAEAIAPMDANVYKFMKLIFRKGSPEGKGSRRSLQRPAVVTACLAGAKFPTSARRRRGDRRRPQRLCLRL